MNDAMTFPAQITMTVSLARGQYGTLRPELEVRLPKTAHFRKVNAALHLLAAQVELATPAGEGWVVQTEALYDGRGVVYLELVKGSDAEAKRGVALLRTIAK